LRNLPDADRVSEKISSFGGQPLVFRDEILGVLAVFNRGPCNRDTFAWLRTFADHAAIAIAHARALNEIERLHEQLLLENTYLRQEIRGDAPDGIVGASPALRKVLELRASRSRRRSRAR
jgi:transcriptional regulator with GAF, ATPase, and Fis domain